MPQAAKIEPTDEALARATAQMLHTIDSQRAECVVQQITNGHAPKDTFAVRDEQPISYGQRIVELEKSERQLRRGVPERVLKRAEELLETLRSQ